MLVKTVAELNMEKGAARCIQVLEFINNQITAMFIAVFVAYYMLGIRRQMGMGVPADPYGKRLWVYRQHPADYHAQAAHSTRF